MPSRVPRRVPRPPRPPRPASAAALLLAPLLLLAAPLRAQARAPALPAAPADTGERTPALEARVDALEQQVRILERLRELARDSAAAAPPRATVVAGNEGFLLRSADGDFQFRARGYVQADGRFFPGDAAVAGASSFLLRRVRPILEATIYRRIGVRLMPDFGTGRVVLQDAYGEVKLASALVLRAGKFKPPVGLERLQSATDVRFVERGFPTDLVPNRDVGLQLGGELGGGALAWAAGVFDGVPDLGNGDGDVSTAKDFAGRLFAQPFLRRGPRALAGLGLGVGASTGIERGTVGAPALASYITPGQQSFFRYRGDGTAAGTVFADGRRTRLVPQGYFYTGPLGFLAEYAVSRQAVRRGAESATLVHHAWQVVGSLLLTGERAAFTTVVPRHPFDPAHGGWGAVELVVRYGELTADSAAFPVYATTASAAQKARAWALGVNWHLVRNVKLMVDYERTSFTGGAADGDRPAEHFLVTRLQTAF